MDKNFDLYCACSLMAEASKFIRDHDREFGLTMLKKVEEYMAQIKVDEKLIQEVKDYGAKIQQGIEEQNQPIKEGSEPQ